MLKDVIRSASVDGARSILVVTDTDSININHDHPVFKELWEHTQNTPDNWDHDYIITLANTSTMQAINDSIQDYIKQNNITDVTVEYRDNNKLYVGSIEVASLIAEHISSMWDQGSDDVWHALINFIAKLSQNPSYRAINNLYQWLRQEGLSITAEGDIIAYKYLNEDQRSVHIGFGIVDGVTYEEDNLPNHVGAHVSMPRHMVDDDPNHGCHFGLHVGTWNFANSYGKPFIATVIVNPANVVSIPHDASYQKMRVSEYDVIAVEKIRATHQPNGVVDISKL